MFVVAAAVITLMALQEFGPRGKQLWAMERVRAKQ